MVDNMKNLKPPETLFCPLNIELPSTSFYCILINHVIYVLANLEVNFVKGYSIKKVQSRELPQKSDTDQQNKIIRIRLLTPMYLFNEKSLKNKKSLRKLCIMHIIYIRPFTLDAVSKIDVLGCYRRVEICQSLYHYGLLTPCSTIIIYCRSCFMLRVSICRILSFILFNTGCCCRREIFPYMRCRKRVVSL